MIEAFVFPYLVGSLTAGMIWLMIRDIITDGHGGMRQEGETGLVFLGRCLAVAAIWPIPTAWLLYLFITEMVIPWLTEPA